MTAIYVSDWEDWEFTGRELEIKEWKKRKEKELDFFHDEEDKNEDNEDEEEISEDAYMPMMNYVFPLDIQRPTNDAILEVHKKTACTVVQSPDGDYFIALTAYGSDMTQDLALAYHILQGRIPYEEAIHVDVQHNIGLSPEDYKLLMKALIEQLKTFSHEIEYKINQIAKELNENGISLEIKS